MTLRVPRFPDNKKPVPMIYDLTFQLDAISVRQIHQVIPDLPLTGTREPSLLMKVMFTLK